MWYVRGSFLLSISLVSGFYFLTLYFLRDRYLSFVTVILVMCDVLAVFCGYLLLVPDGNILALDSMEID